MLLKTITLSILVGLFIQPLSALAEQNDVITSGDVPDFDFAWDILSLDRASGDVIELRTRDLENFDQESITTTTIWTEGLHTFTGPTLLDVLRATGFTTNHIEMKAFNDYVVDLYVSAPMVTDKFPIIATRIDGERFAINEKGPFWIIYPYDSDEIFNKEPYPGLSIWQLIQITGLEK